MLATVCEQHLNLPGTILRLTGSSVPQDPRPRDASSEDCSRRRDDTPW